MKGLRSHENEKKRLERASTLVIDCNLSCARILLAPISEFKIYSDIFLSNTFFQSAKKNMNRFSFGSKLAFLELAFPKK